MSSLQPLVASSARNTCWAASSASASGTPRRRSERHTESKCSDTAEASRWLRSVVRDASCVGSCGCDRTPSLGAATAGRSVEFSKGTLFISMFSRSPIDPLSAPGLAAERCSGSKTEPERKSAGK